MRRYRASFRPWCDVVQGKGHERTDRQRRNLERDRRGSCGQNDHGLNLFHNRILHVLGGGIRIIRAHRDSRRVFGQWFHSGRTALPVRSLRQANPMRMCSRLSPRITVRIPGFSSDLADFRAFRHDSRNGWAGPYLVRPPALSTINVAAYQTSAKTSVQFASAGGNHSWIIVSMT